MPELIDRCELRKDFCDMCEAMQPEMIDCTKKGCMSMQIIDEQPTIEPEVRHGRWIVRGQDIYCSECNDESLYNPFGASKFSDFCPNCGARMDGGADNA